MEQLQHNLQLSLNQTADWFNSNRLVVNASKSSTMIITTPYNITNICKPLSLKINDATLEHNTSSKLLGIMIDQTLKWDTHVKYICKKINPKIGLIHRLRKILPTKVLSTLYLTLIQPHIDYCISVWGACALKYINLIQQLQNRAARAVTGIFDYNQSVSAIINSLNWMTDIFIFLGYLFINVLITLPLLPLLNVSMSWMTVDFTTLEQYQTRILSFLIPIYQYVKQAFHIVVPLFGIHYQLQSVVHPHCLVLNIC